MTPAERDRLYYAIRRRLQRDDSVLKLSQRSGINRTTLYTWTSRHPKNTYDPEWESLRALAKGLGLRMWELVREIELEPHEVPRR